MATNNVSRQSQMSPGRQNHKSVVFKDRLLVQHSICTHIYPWVQSPPDYSDNEEKWLAEIFCRVPEHKYSTAMKPRWKHGNSALLQRVQWSFELEDINQNSLLLQWAPVRKSEKQQKHKNNVPLREVKMTGALVLMVFH